MTDLHCFTDDCDTVIASSTEDAQAVWNEWNSPSSLTLDHDPEAWEQIDDGSEITIHCDYATGHPATPGDDGVSPITKTAGEWAKRGRGFLCTTEF